MKIIKINNTDYKCIYKSIYVKLMKNVLSATLNCKWLAIKS